MNIKILAVSLVCFVAAVPMHSRVLAQTQQFRFAWLTDTHVGSPTGEDDLRRSVRDINSLGDIPFVIVSGDITEMGTTAELEQANRVLDSLRMPYHVIPGNHDTKWTESGCTMFSRLWKDDKFVFEYGGCRFIACSSGPNMRMGDGHVPVEDLRWLDSVITHMPDKSEPVIFINHYPLDDGLDNWYDVLAEIKRVNTIAALCGHGHVNKPLSFEDVPGTMGRSNLRAGKSFGGYTLVGMRRDSILFSERTPLSGLAQSERRWHAIANIRHPYEKDRTVYPRPDYSVNQKYPAARVRWQVLTGSTIGSSPAIAGSRVIVGSQSAGIAAYSLRDGKKLWKYNPGGSVYSSAAIGVVSGKSRTGAARTPRGRHAAPDTDSIVCAVAGSSNGTLSCLDVNTGKLLWKLQARGPIVASPLIADGIVYCGSSDGVFRAVSLATGETVWEFPGVSGFVESTPLVYEGKIIFGAWDTFLYALDIRTGALAWKWSNGSPVRNLSPAACTPVGANGKIFIVAPDRYMTAIDAATGTTVWRSSAHVVRETIGLSEDSSTVYVRTMNDSLFAVSSSAPAQTVLWSLNCMYGYDIDPSMPVEKAGSVFFGTKNGLVYCVNAHTHELTGCRKIGNSVVSTVKPISSSEVVVTSMDGTVARISFK